MQKLHRIYPNISAKCWHCPVDPATYIHVRSYWKECIKKCTLIVVPLVVDVCIRGLVHLLIMSRAMRTLIGWLLFYARKAILLKWKSLMAPTLDFWKSLINSAIPLLNPGVVVGNSPKHGISGSPLWEQTLLGTPPWDPPPFLILLH